MKIILSADHAGFDLKESVKTYLLNKGLDVSDVGAQKKIDGDDYPEYMAKAAMKVAEDMSGNTKAIIFGGSGQGEAIMANRFPGVRAVVWYGDPNLSKQEKNNVAELDIIRLSREHNDANVLSIGARFVTEDDAISVIDRWLDTKFSGDERHVRRNDLIDSIE